MRFPCLGFASGEKNALDICFFASRWSIHNVQIYSLIEVRKTFYSYSRFNSACLITLHMVSTVFQGSTLWWNKEGEGNIGSNPVPRLTASHLLLPSSSTVIDGSRQFLILHSFDPCFVGRSGSNKLTNWSAASCEYVYDAPTEQNYHTQRSV